MIRRPFLFWHIWRAGHSNRDALANIQQQRLAELVTFTRSRSPFYAQHYHKLTASCADLRALPPVTKPLLMAHFDDWVTDTAVTRTSIDKFIADPSLVGQPYLDRYMVHTTSGSTGTPGIFLHDSDALAVYDLVWLLRGWLPWLGPWRLLDSLRPSFREVFLVATGAHFGGAATSARLRQRYPWMAGRLQNVSVLLPLSEQVQQLTHLQPTVLAVYPTALSLLTKEQSSGRLSISPLLIVTSGEWLSPTVHDAAVAAFNCPVRNMYACSEFIYMGFACDEGWLHINSDWLILEPVNVNNEPVSPGQPSYTVLLTNLANHVQPLIRYDLGDSITLKPELCPCGNPLPALRVEGRRDEILKFPTPDGSTVQVLPMALATIIETTPGVQQYQVIQTDQTTLTVRMEVMSGADRSQVWETAVLRLQAYLASQGIVGVTIRETADPPQRDSHSGKFCQISSEVKHTL